MSAHRLRASRLLTPEALAGWIFADLLIVLFIVGLGAAIHPPEPGSSRDPSSSPTPTPTTPRKAPSPTPKPKPSRPAAVKPKPVLVLVDFNASDLLAGGKRRSGELLDVCSQLRKDLRAKKYDDDEAALVLIFAGGPRTAIGVAQQRAAIIGRKLKSCRSQRVFDRSVVWRDYWDGDLQSGRARLEIFLYIKS